MFYLKKLKIKKYFTKTEKRQPNKLVSYLQNNFLLSIRKEVLASSENNNILLINIMLDTSILGKYTNIVSENTINYSWFKGKCSKVIFNQLGAFLRACTYPTLINVSRQNY